MKPAVVIYIEQYCAPTMTFVHRQVLALSNYFEVIVVCRKRLNEDRFPGQVTCIRRNIFVRALGYLKRKSQSGVYFPSARFIKQLRSIIKDKRPIAVISHFGPAGIEINDAIKDLDIKKFCVIHGYDGSKMLRNPGYLRQLNNCTDTNFVFASKSMMKNFQTAGVTYKGFVHYLGYQGVETSAAARNKMIDKTGNGERIVFFQAANLVEKKGHKYSLEALSRFQKSYGNFEYLIAGAGPLENELKTLAIDLGIAEKVKFLGHLSGTRLQHAFDKADIFLHHSLTAKDGDQESIPTVIMEAMFQGIPVISTRHSGIPELIQHKYNGYLSDEKDVQSFVENITLATSDDGKIGRNAHHTVVSEFNFSKQINLLATKLTDLK